MTVVVEDGDSVIIPRGYHTVVAAPGYELRYVWALCGTERIYGAWRDDPEYVWVRDEQALLHSKGWNSRMEKLDTLFDIQWQVVVVTGGTGVLGYLVGQ